MNLQSDENGLRYVFTLSTPNKKLRLKRVNVDDVSTEGLGHIIRCKRVASLKDVIGTMKDNSNIDDVELTVVPATEDTIVENKTNNENESWETPSKKQKTESSMEQSSSKLKVVPVSKVTSIHADIRSNSVTSYAQNSSADDGDQEYVSLSTYSAKCVTSDSQERRQGKYKVFRDEWLDIDIFRDWLDRDPTNPRRARCVACNTTMNAGKSELEKHAAGARHERAVEAMHESMMLQQLAAADAEAEQEAEIIDEESSNEATREGEQASISVETTQPILMEQSLNPEDMVSWREQQVDAMNRVASAIESLSSNVALLLERLASQQIELISAVREIGKK